MWRGNSSTEQPASKPGALPLTHTTPARPSTSRSITGVSLPVTVFRGWGEPIDSDPIKDFVYTPTIYLALRLDSSITSISLAALAC